MGVGGGNELGFMGIGGLISTKLEREQSHAVIGLSSSFTG